MWTRRLILPALLTLVLGATACAGAHAKGECQDYKPLGACSLEFDYVCQTTEDGCEQCACVLKRGPGGAGPDSPFDGSYHH